MILDERCEFADALALTGTGTINLGDQIPLSVARNVGSPVKPLYLVITIQGAITGATSVAFQLVSDSVNPPALVIPSPAPGSRHAATRASSRPGRIARQSGSRWSADACGAPVASFRAEAARPSLNPMMWSRSVATEESAQGVGASRAESGTPSSSAASRREAASRSRTVMR